MQRISAGIRNALAAAARWYTGLARGWLIGLTSFVLLAAIIASVGMYRVYDYVQHDNAFCTGCHLMQDPFARFEESSHRGLGCKACHRPNIWERSSMGLIQIIERPDSMTRHAHVPSETCGDCHVKGNPDEWKLIANSAGHRVHLSSAEPALEKIECLTCHGAGVHNFTAADKTCGQSGCHENTGIELGGMSSLTIHCASCHDFNKPLAAATTADSLAGVLTPARNDCFSCHAMRAQVGATIPLDEPHNGVCGTCHNPHEQATPADAVLTCAQGGCHQRVDTLTALHRDLPTGALQNCTSCHAAHNWKVKGEDCSSCHRAEDLDDPARKPIKRLHTAPVQQNVFDVVLAPTRLLLALVAEPPFRHKLHKSVACKTCHESDDGHGVLKIRTAADCAGCHHSAENRTRCGSCHTSSKLERTYRRSFTWRLSVWKTPRERALDFTHQQHAGSECQACHNSATSLRSTASCTSCHADHHSELRSCTSCHSDVKKIEEHTGKAHASCTTSGCHADPATSTLRTQRNVCLVCHTDKVEHEPQGDCATCHMIPKRTRELSR